MIDAFGVQNYIANLGHGITEHTPPENVDVMLATVREYSQQFHVK